MHKTHKQNEIYLLSNIFQQQQTIITRYQSNNTSRTRKYNHLHSSPLYRVLVQLSMDMTIHAMAKVFVVSVDMLTTT